MTTTKKPSTKRKAKALNKHSVRHSYLEQLEIRVTEKGFTIYTIDKVKGTDGKMRDVKHWVVDASCLREDGMLRFGCADMYPTEARIDLEANNVRISRKR